MPDGNSSEIGVSHPSQSQESPRGHNTNSATSSRRPSSHTSTRSRRRSPSPSRDDDSKTPLTPEESPPFKLTRKRTAGIVELEDKELDETTSTPVHSRGSSNDSTAHVCICQPDPKIPRPRNGELRDVRDCQEPPLILAAFILYRQHHQAQVVSQHPGLANPEISKIIGEQWQNQSAEVKAKWKGLAEEEKLRHQQQYPSYRYQPKRNGRRGSISSDANGEKPKCQKCGGRSLLGPSTPFPQSAGSTSTSGVPPTPRSAITPRSRTLPPVFRDLSLQSPAGRRMARTYQGGQMSPLPNGGHYDDRDDLGPLSPEIKRRKYSDHPSSAQRSLPPRYTPASGQLVGPGTPFPFGPMQPQPQPQQQQQHPYPPALAHIRRETLPGIRGVVSPSGPMSPPPRPGMGYQQHRISHGHIIPDRSLVLPPLQTGSTDISTVTGGPATATATAAGKSPSDQIMTIPFRYKLKVLRQVAPPASHLASSPRGPLIVLEGDTPSAVAELGKWLFAELGKGEDLAVKMHEGPDLEGSAGKGPMVRCHLVATEWLGRSEGIVEGLAYGDVRTSGGDQAMVDATPMLESAISTRMIEEDYDDAENASKSSTTDTPAGEQDQPANTPETMDVDKKTSVPLALLTPANHTTTTITNHNDQKKKPVSLIPNFSLHASNTFARLIPLGPNDPYSPSDHWQWTATQWRGIVGPDLAIYMRDAISAEGGEAGKVGVEVLEDGVIVVSRLVGKESGGEGLVGLEGSVLRRLGFEVGEWVRAFGGG
ncbi:hypothetical protein LTR62_004480 [Meristemomyces frigidus]|uniref:HMG box domain-containing protein n=1 Tax=Meristemomyces frigidus TaxID=1508187 RepID=A0AAN7TER0_9PEZI|nr:hypothetical protein LTR62_004480 [Meristemomyces frigidus]